MHRIQHIDKVLGQQPTPIFFVLVKYTTIGKKIEKQVLDNRTNLTNLEAVVINEFRIGTKYLNEVEYSEPCYE